ncbi:DUF3079 domain-containing protein [Paraburkholderia youngii]|uniref:DUF3079 domain-containing protein n=1 Tax=Paraburkholderia youngii TaxID=2782701 RepID=UPI003D19DC9B
MAKKFPIHPLHPERVCWGCDHYCPAKDMRCGNWQSRAQHPAELLGDDWSFEERRRKHRYRDPVDASAMMRSTGRPSTFFSGK